MLHCPPSIKDLIRRSDCLMGAFKSEKGLPRDYSGVPPPLLGPRRMNSGQLTEHWPLLVLIDSQALGG